MKKFYNLVIVVCSILIFLIHIAEGASVSDSFDIKNAVTPGNYKGDLTGTVHKTVNFQRENGHNTSQSFELDINKKITLKPKETTGEWFIKSSYSDSPPMDGGWYAPTSGTIYGPVWFGIRASEPFDETGVLVTSKNPHIVSCVDKVCTALKAGTATIEVKFPKEIKKSNFSCSCLPDGGSTMSVCYNKVKTIPATNISGQSHSFKNTNSGYGKFTIAGFSSDPIRYDCYGVTYNFPDITYTITVPPAPNQVQVSACNTITNLTNTEATVNWTYSDIDNDPQTNYQIQIATDANFSTIVQSIVAPANTNVSTTRSRIITNLIPNTFYYTRIRTYNTTNLWSTYKNCSGFTTTPLPLITACTASNTSIQSEQPITWTTTVSGGTGAYTYSWSGTNGLNGNTNSLIKTYTTPGNKTATVTITSGTQTQTTTCPSIVVVSDVCANIGDFQGNIPSGLQQSGNNCICPI